MVEYLLEGLNLKPIIIGHILVKIQNETKAQAFSLIFFDCPS